MNREPAPDRDGHGAPTGLSHPAEQRVSMLVGDRLCVQCGYNLIGQTIMREPHYQLLIVRCTECGTVASLQEYPMLGRWANRWAAVLAAFWFLIMLVLVMGGGAAIFGFSMGAAHDATRTFSQHISNKYQAHAQEAAKTAGNAAPAYSPADMKVWRDAQDFDALFQEAGGWKAGVNWYALAIWIPGAICVFAIGCFASIALLTHHTRTRYLVGALIIMAGAAYSYLFGYLIWVDQQVGWYWNNALLLIGPRLLLLSLAIGSIALLAGMMLGRKIVRGLMRVLLPPRLLHALALLWIVDGVPPPRAR
jgi:hypothetical protein